VFWHFFQIVIVPAIVTVILMRPAIEVYGSLMNSREKPFPFIVGTSTAGAAAFYVILALIVALVVGPPSKPKKNEGRSGIDLPSSKRQNRSGT
jgi:hypothetical protein